MFADHRFPLRHFDVLALAGLRAMVQCCERGRRGDGAGVGVAIGDGGLVRALAADSP